MRLFHILLLGTVVASPQEQQTRIRVSATEVQVDAVVRDANGHIVTDLSRDDFEVFSDGKLQRLTSVALVEAGHRSTIRPSEGVPPRIPTAAQLRREQVRRTIALVVDDLKMSFESVNHTRTALRTFVDRQMQPGDLVAIISTSGLTPLHQFTNDKRMLHAAINRVRFMLTPGGPSGASIPLGAEALNAPVLAADRVVQHRFAVGTLGTVRYVAAGMRSMPGRKSLVLFSDGFPIFSRAQKEAVVHVDDARHVTEEANRSAVVIYSVDPRGIPQANLQAQDDTSGMEQEEVRAALEGRELRFRDAQQSLRFLAEETGGTAQLFNNDLNVQLDRMMEDQSTYYLLGFQPTDKDRPGNQSQYHRISIKLRRPGLRIQHRRGYMGNSLAGITDPQTPRDRLWSALSLPFADQGLHLRLTPAFAVTNGGDAVIRTLIFVPGSDLTFAPPDHEGARTAKLQVVCVTEGDDPKSATPVQKTHTIRLKPDEISRLTKEGIVYALEQQVTRPGPYNLRIAVMDLSSGRTGSGWRFVEVPDIKRRKLALSGITMGLGDWRSPPPQSPETQAVDVSPAVRIFQRGRMFSYGVTVYNAGNGSQAGHSRVELQPRLIRGDQVVWEGRRIPVLSTGGEDLRRLPSGGALTLGEKTLPGDYLLELQAIDLNGKQATVSQWIDFELR